MLRLALQWARRIHRQRICCERQHSRLREKSLSPRLDGRTSAREVEIAQFHAVLGAVTKNLSQSSNLVKVNRYANIILITQSYSRLVLAKLRARTA